MKIFDWKRRDADESVLNDPDASVWTLSTLKAAPGSRKRKTRKGRGISAGQGATCGFGMRGQASRAGRPERPGFEGGQTPLYRRLPKFVGKPTRPGHSKTIYNIIKLDSLNSAAPGSVCNFDSLLESGAVTKSKLDIHKVVVGSKDFTAKDVTVQAHAFTNAAREAIENAGGKCEVLKKTTGEVITA
jgi:large subunit ribosomal protein L15